MRAAAFIIAIALCLCLYMNALRMQAHANEQQEFMSIGGPTYDANGQLLPQLRDFHTPGIPAAYIDEASAGD
jgi:hypothetical protein